MNSDEKDETIKQLRVIVNQKDREIQQLECRILEQTEKSGVLLEDVLKNDFQSIAETNQDEMLSKYIQKDLSRYFILSHI